jgi:circadian clock protein KaiC
MLEHDARPRPGRTSTGIPSLDPILGGGFMRGSLVMIMGPPGCGKTLLGNQIAFNHVAAGGRAVYVTHFGETHGRLFEFLQPMAFFQPEVVGKELVYLSGLGPLETDATAGLMDMIRDALRSTGATLLVLDEMLSVELFAHSQKAFERFLHGLQAHVAGIGCTALLLTTHMGDAPALCAQPIVDEIIQLDYRRRGLRTDSEIEVIKLRGGAFVRGRHGYDIDDAGLTFFPRTEAVFGATPPIATNERASSGILDLDAMIMGGWPRASTTLLLGAAGTGKTLMGLQYLRQGALQGERGLCVSCYESPDELLHVGRVAGIDVADAVKRDLLTLEWQPRREQHVDAVASRLIDLVRSKRPSRVFVDSMDALLHAAVFPQRMSDFFSALTKEIRALGATTVWAVEVHTPQGTILNLPVPNVSGVAENILMLRSLELPTGLHRFVTVRKVRGSAFDSSTHEMWISPSGIRVAPSAESAVALLEEGGVRGLGAESRLS